ncbi:MAG: fructose-bisphosphatase class III [Neobacillus sp.]
MVEQIISLGQADKLITRLAYTTQRLVVDHLHVVGDHRHIMNGQLVAHKHFNSKEDVLLNGTDILSIKRVVNEELKRKKVRETIVGEKLLQEISILNSLREYRYMN